MSGGHWSYDQNRINDILSWVGHDSIVIRRFPKIGQIYSDLARLLDKTMAEMDWDICCDSKIENDEEFEKDFINKLGKIIEKKYKIKVYEIEEE